MDEESITQVLHKKYGEVATIPRDCPWIEPPEWWELGLRAWGDLLTAQWEIAKSKPLTQSQKIAYARMARHGQAVANEMQRLAIEVLTGEHHEQTDDR
jgi:hypothetical protein